VTVVAGQAAPANFLCLTQPVSPAFGIEFGNPPANWWHGITDSDLCTGLITNPPRPGATYTITWTGPGIIGANQRTDVFDGSGRALARQRIVDFGMHTVAVTSTANGFTANASAQINVTPAAGTCPPRP
jgi:hypothetical protein